MCHGLFMLMLMHEYPPIDVSSAFEQCKLKDIVGALKQEGVSWMP